MMPLEGSIPDMTCTTEWYVELQRLYRDKADADADAVLLHARRFLRAAGKPGGGGRARARFSSAAAHARGALALGRGRAAWADGAGAALAAKLADPDATAAGARRATSPRAVDVFRETRGRYPGTPLSTGPSNSEDTNSTTVNTACDVDADVEALRAIVETTLDAIGAEADRARTGALEAMTTEAARCAGGEPHAVAAVLGGVGAQGVIKLVTDQFEPEAHTLGTTPLCRHRGGALTERGPGGAPARVPPSYRVRTRST